MDDETLLSRPFVLGKVVVGGPGKLLRLKREVALVICRQPQHVASCSSNLDVVLHASCDSKHSAAEQLA